MSIHRILSFPDWLDREYPGVDYINAEKHYVEEYIDYKDNLIEGMTNFEANIMEWCAFTKLPWQEQNDQRCTNDLNEPVIALNVTPKREYHRMMTSEVNILREDFFNMFKEVECECGFWAFADETAIERHREECNLKPVVTFDYVEMQAIRQDAGMINEKIIPRRQSTVSYNSKRDLQEWRNQMKRRCEA